MQTRAAIASILTNTNSRRGCERLEKIGFLIKDKFKLKATIEIGF